MKNCLLWFCFVVFGVSLPADACTVFYASDGQLMLGGSNEDWSDPHTGVFFIPAEAGKHGWVKFGFMSGWPQGGMNDQGLFWDATACSALDMPDSEANKEKFDGPLMQKVMEECGTVQEALCLFEKYYCDDQYKAQYLIGDTTGNSVIVEGDCYILKDKNYQVMTNFYQSHPDLGGYPCWRYETAVSMLESTDEISTDLFGAILSATHQEGRYPTQYSNIYDLKSGVVYLCYFHNFEEFISIDLKANLEKGRNTHDLPSLFSHIKILGPSSGSRVNPSSVTLRWQGKKTSQYQLYCSVDPHFTDCDPMPVTASHSSHPMVLFATVLMGMACMGAGSRKRGVAKALIGLTFVWLILSVQCKGRVTDPSESAGTIQEMHITLENLEKDVTYYWKVVARPEGNRDFTSESLVQRFETTN